MYSARSSIRLRTARAARSSSSSSISSSNSIGGGNSSSSSTRRSAAVEVQAARNYCLNLLRTFDSPSYVLQTFIPPSARDAYLAIRAFNIDVARVADSVSNPTVGAMRMQFWRDNIGHTLRGSPPKEPVAVLLAHALGALEARGGRRLSRGWFFRVIAAREQYLGNPPYPNLAALETYAENTYSALLYLTLSALPLSSIATDHIASHIGKATGIAAVLRGLPLLAFPPPPNHHNNPIGLGGMPAGVSRRGAVTLPLDIMAEAEVRDEDILRLGSEAPGLRDAVFAVATRANDHLITAREMLKNIQAGGDAGHDFEHQGEADYEYPDPDQAKDVTAEQEVARGFGVLMPAVATKLWLERLERVGFDIFSPQLRKREWRLPWKSYWAFRRRMF
ncbi:MAG: hypothetical protein M1840_006616 [Geoglossum simile]|nr:MAG: hypothetical protein M1840_006616 [Geoglossum simile]